MPLWTYFRYNVAIKCATITPGKPQLPTGKKEEKLMIFNAKHEKILTLC